MSAAKVEIELVAGGLDHAAEQALELVWHGEPAAQQVGAHVLGAGELHEAVLAGSSVNACKSNNISKKNTTK